MDGDGDQDLVVNDLNGPPSLFENHAQGHRIAVRLMGQKGNLRALEPKSSQRKRAPDSEHEVVGGGRYLSGGDPMVVFGISEKASESS